MGLYGHYRLTDHEIVVDDWFSYDLCQNNWIITFTKKIVRTKSLAPAIVTYDNWAYNKITDLQNGEIL